MFLTPTPLLIAQDLERGAFEDLEKWWSAKVTWGVHDLTNGMGTLRDVKPHWKLPDGSVWFEHDRVWVAAALQQPGTKVWDFLETHGAPCFPDRPRSEALKTLLVEALNVDRPDLVHWLRARGAVLDPETTPPASVTYQKGVKTTAGMLARVWHAYLDQGIQISPALDGHSAHPRDLLRMSIELAMNNEACVSVVERLLKAGADIQTNLPRRLNDEPWVNDGFTSTQGGGTVLHTLANVASDCFSQPNFFDREGTQDQFTRMWDILVQAGADPEALSPAGFRAEDQLKNDEPKLFDLWDNRRRALARAEIALELPSETVLVPVRARIRP